MTIQANPRSTRLARNRSLAARVAALLVAGFFALHGLAHIVGIKGIWGIGAPADNSSTYLTGLDPHSAAYVALGGVWLAACLLFLASAAGIVLRRTWWLPIAFAAAALSLVLCVLWRDAAVVGLVVNAAILVGLMVFSVVRRAS